MNIILLCLTFSVIILTVRLIGNRMHFRTILEKLYMYQSNLHSASPHAFIPVVTSTIIPKLYSNACDYLYIMHVSQVIHFSVFLESSFSK